MASQRFRPPTRRLTNMAPMSRSGWSGNEYMGFWIRVAAGILDVLILFGIYGIWVALGVGVEVSLLDEGEIDIAGAFSIFWVTVLLFLILAHMIGYWIMMALRGESIGKWIIGIKVVNDVGDPPGFALALLRESFFLFKWFNPFYLLGLVAGAWDPEKQSVWDHLAHTHVVRSR